MNRILSGLLKLTRRRFVLRTAAELAGGLMEFRLLGAVEVHVEGRAISVGPPQQRLVLAALASDAGRPVSTDTLVDRIWDQAPDGCRRTLHMLISRLRRQLTEATPPGYGPIELARRSGGYVLRIDPDRVDAHRFARLAQQASNEVEADRQARLLREALDLWQGEPLTGLSGQWASRTREAWYRQYLDAAVAWGHAELRLGRPGAVIGPLTTLADEHPLVESVAVALMRTLHAAGRPAEALECYTRIRRRLADELGVDPGAALQAVHQAILRGEPHASRPVPAARPKIRARSEAAAAGAGWPVPAQLPADVSGFTGRRAYLDMLDARDAAPVTVICGTAGVGKTALAVHWAHRARAGFPDGQLYVNLRGHAPASALSPLAALGQLLTALHVPGSQLPTQVEPAAGLYRSLLADRRVLVLLDDAASAEQVRPLLPGGGGCRSVVTSRYGLSGLVAWDGARRVALGVLEPDESVALLGALVGPPRMDAGSAGAARLARVCGQLPLALRIAAANAVEEGWADLGGYAEVLYAGNRLDALTLHGDPEAAVRAAFDRSYQRLPAAARRLFRLLGLPAGRDIGVAAAAALLGASEADTRDVLARLCAASLLERGAAARYTMHDLLRLYAVERAEVDEPAIRRAAALDRLHEHLLATVDACARRLYPHVLRLPAKVPTSSVEILTEPAATAWLDAERQLLIATAVRCATEGPHQVGWLLADWLRGYLMQRMHAHDWTTLADACLAAAEAEADVPALVAGRISRAVLRWRQGDGDAAAENFTLALDLARRIGWVEAQAAATGNLGAVHHMAGRLAQATEHYRQALALNQRIGSAPGQLINRYNLAALLELTGYPDEAARQQKLVMAAHRDAGDVRLEASVRVEYAETLYVLGRYEESYRLLTGVLPVLREVGDEVCEALARWFMANVLDALDRPAEALAAVEQALDLARRIGHCRVEAGALIARCGLLLKAERIEEACADHARAAAIARAAGDRHNELNALNRQSAIALARGDAAHAASLARDALAGARATGYRAVEAAAGTALAQALRAAGDGDAARRAARAALRVYDETGYDPGRKAAAAVLGRSGHDRLTPSIGGGGP